MTLLDRDGEYLDRVRDSRGILRTVPMADDAPANGREQMLARARSVLHGTARGRNQRWFQTLVVTVVAATASSLICYMILFPGQMGMAVSLALVMAAVFGCGVYFQPDPIPSPEEAGQLLRECRLCLACGYDMNGCKVENDGCTVCPECGAAWRLE